MHTDTQRTFFFWGGGGSGVEQDRIADLGGNFWLHLCTDFAEKTVNLESEHFYLQMVTILTKQVSLPSLVTGPHNLQTV